MTLDELSDEQRAIVHALAEGITLVTTSLAELDRVGLEVRDALQALGVLEQLPAHIRMLL